ncbi:hypothetical protein GCM10010124_11810 [Pilimelia terevasa]|uniref:Peptidase S8/S53 domain-containing protein n=1 Tax=Pilimelia terevasa TaxID=53372 RepID=A0A8J3BM31_9ACTN|nr:S8 family serine peptidase [Pilimelia terevasa]GGK20951.1 hypothetical protein GCM10010124_11810 [Pilimelia terevasa]
MRASAVFALALSAVGLPGVAVVLPAAPAHAACRPDSAAGIRADARSWALEAIGPDRVAPFADGTGVVVAVLDSGVDRRHPQLRDAVLPGADFLGGGSAAADCVGHGTAVAGLIAAAPRAGVTVRGLAPGARILPVRVSEQRTVGGRVTGRAAPPGRLAEAVRWAVRRGARVLNLSLVLDEDVPAVRAAVAEAVRADIVVVAAAGRAGHRDRTPYPAAYPQVLGVGPAGPRGAPVPGAPAGPHVDLLAPGQEVLVPWPGGYAQVTGSSFAAPAVAAAAALLRQRHPHLTAAEVGARLRAAADPAPGAAAGAGLLNPHRALTMTMSPAAAGPTRLATRRRDPAHAATARRRADRAALARTVAAAGAAVLAAAGVAALVRPRRRGRLTRTARDCAAP